MADTANTEAAGGTGFNKVLRLFDMTLFTVCAILVIDQLPASAAIGVQSVFWWIFTLVFFFVPYGLITAELGSTYPDEGGIYAWVKRAFGDRWGGRTAWLWWINVALWQPSVFILFAGIFATLFFPGLSLWAQIGIALALTWITVWTNIIALDVGKWVPNLGALFKSLIMVLIGIGGFYLAWKNGPANEISFSTMAPSWDASLAFLPVIVYNFLGFELMSGAGAEMKNPGRDVPLAILIAGVIIATFYLLGTFGILAAIPLEEINLIEGLIDTFRQIFGTTGAGGALVAALGLMAMYTFFSNMVTWTIGANRSASEAAIAGDLPEGLGKLHPVHKTPATAAIWTGVITTVVMIVYGLMAATAEDLFWALFAFSSIIFLLPYFLLFSAFLKLRSADSARPRPYKVPGGWGTAVILALICMAFILQAIVFFVYTPGEFDIVYASQIVIGVIVTVIIGEFLISRGKRA
ncbi:APC family permease [Methyloligella sp. 2.7D]|uniref:APC family permease n=1 Tax=unclassified Methyloligella TaxID=2625955 RepID=UPI00157DD98F|nr:APC family permease [Methyloligella sp. GL2]QKP77441.1 amino acid permease [Methyloligella sp. GL2]